MPASLANRRASLCQAKRQPFGFMIFCIFAGAIMLLTFTDSVNAIDQMPVSYISPAAMLVMTEPLADISGGTPIKLLATGSPSRILLTEKEKVGIGHWLPKQFTASVPVTNIKSDKIGVIRNIDGTHVVVGAGGYPGPVTYDIGLIQNNFATSDEGKNIALLKKVSTISHIKLSRYKSLD